MKTEKGEIIIAEEIIISKIYNIRGKQVMLATDLAELYQVETRALNQQVKRNIGKFPDRYMFQLIKDEYDRLRSQNVILKGGQHVKYLPFEKVQTKLDEHENQIGIIFEYLKQLEQSKLEETDFKKRKRIGFKSN